MDYMYKSYFKPGILYDNGKNPLLSIFVDNSV